MPAPSPRALVPELTAEFDTLILRLLAKEPGERFANAVQAVDALASLPTAPERSLNLPRLASHTIEAFRIPGKRRFGWGAAATLVILLGGLGWLVSRGGVGLPTINQRVDSALADTVEKQPVVLSPVDSAKGRDSTPVAVTKPAPAPAKPNRPVLKRAALDLTATDSAELYLDNRLLGTAKWSGDIDASERIELRAVVPDAPTNCRTALRDTVLTNVRAGDRVTLNFNVRGCVPVQYDVEPRDARVLFKSLDGPFNIETRADSAISVLLPIGRYLLQVTAPRCLPYNDTVVVKRGQASGPKPIKVTFCPK